jgi:beta-lactamase regulating signal transducer with metallopeptidase domain
MITEQMVFSFVIGAIVTLVFNLRITQEEKLEVGSIKKGEKTQLVEPLLLPSVLIITIGMMLMRSKFTLSLAFISESILIFMYISIYYIILLLLLPILRKFISARACSTLWMLPTMLYLAIQISDSVAAPRFVITVSHQWFKGFAMIWAVGFVGTLLWFYLSHFTYRTVLLRHAQMADDAVLLKKWRHESARHGIKSEISIYISEQVNTPLTIGCFDRTMALVLPHQHYTDDAITLIFQHELRHIIRTDSRMKLFINLCTAIFWFNPLAWIAQRKAADDLELSCDEAVLVNADERTRRLYAELLLSSAGSSRGFTTRLSAAGSTLRYRLKNVMTPSKRIEGSLVIGLAMALLIMSLGSVGIADSANTVEHAIFESIPKNAVIDSIHTNEWREDRQGYLGVYAWQEEALTTYIASLHVKRVYAGNYVDYDLRELILIYGERDGDDLNHRTRLALSDDLLIVDLPDDDYRDIFFLVEDAIDWPYLESLLDFDAVDPDPAPVPPEMMLYFNEQVNTDGELMHAARTIIYKKSGDVAQDINPFFNNDTPGGVTGFPVTEVKLSFSYAPAGDYKITVEDWERDSSYSILSSELEDNVLKLAPYSAHYTVYGTFDTVRDTTYEMMFEFDIMLP